MLYIYNGKSGKRDEKIFEFHVTICRDGREREREEEEINCQPLLIAQIPSLHCQYPYYQRTFHIQATSVFVPAFEPYSLTQDLQESLEARATSFCEQWETFLSRGGESIALSIIT